MKELERHIEILLLSNDCVIIPGFGGFMAHHVNARYDESECIYLPPQRTIGFNPQLTLNDSLLVQSYIEAYDLSYPEALRRIEDEVREIRQQIEEEGYFELFKLGTIYLNDSGVYIFEPYESGILSPELYGLNTFLIKPFHLHSNLLHLEKSKNKNTDDSVKEERVNHVSTLRNIAIACCVLFAFFLLSSPIGNSEIKDNEARINTKILCRIIPRCENLGTSTLKIENNKGEIKRNRQLVYTKPLQQEDKVPYYTVVLSSRITIRNAQLYVNQLHEVGLDNAIVSTHGRYTKVISGQYASEIEAVTAASNIKKNITSQIVG